MKRFFLVTCIITFSLVTLRAQTGSIKGIVQDTTASLPLEGATVTVLGGDSSLVSFTKTNSSGIFLIRHLLAGQYRVVITHTGYPSIQKAFAIATTLPDIDFGTIAVTSKATVLKEVTVLQDKPPVTIRHDTIEFNAGSFKTKPNAVVEDLLKKLPGVQVDKDGKIKSNGEEVKKVLLDGKEFFGNDPKMPTKNLPADAVDKVQVYNRKSDQARFTGFDDGNSEKTINLTIKADKKNGVFGKATAGAGDKGLYEGNFNVNSFNGERQASAIGMANNTNKQGFSFLDILNFSGALPGAGGRSQDLSTSGLPIQGANNSEGLVNTRAGGFNYNNTWQKKLDFMSNYFYNRQQTAILENVQQQWLLPGNNFITTKENRSNNTNESNRANVTGDYKIDSANALKITTAINVQQSTYNTSSQYKSVSANGSLLNDGQTNSFISGQGYSWNNNALFRHRFAKKGRTFSANLSLNINNNKSNGGLMSANNLYQPAGGLLQADTINQLNHQTSRSSSYGIALSYTEPLSKRFLLELQYNFNTAHSTASKKTYDIDTIGEKQFILNDTLSNRFSSDYTYHRPGVNWRYHANLQYNISQYKNIRMLYNTFTQQPSVTQLQPLADNTDPLNIVIGNPALKQEFYQQLRADYISFDPYRHTSFFAGLSAGITGHKIVNADQPGAQGQRITQPVNVNGTYNVRLITSWGFPVKRIKSKINLNSSVAQNHNIGFINMQKNNIRSWSGSQELTWNYAYKELFDVGAGASVSYNNVQYSLQKQQNTQYWNQQYTVEANVYLPKGFSFSSDADYTVRTGLAPGYNLELLSGMQTLPGRY